MDKPLEERRRFIRLEVPIEVKYVIENDLSHVRRQASTKDLSCDGLRFISGQSIDEGSILDLNLIIPGASNPVHIKGKTIWSKRTSNDDTAPVEVGVEFVQIEEDNKNTFLRYLCDLIYNETKIMERSGKIKYQALFLLPLLLACISGCAEINPFEAPQEVIKHPLGTESIRRGSTKEAVIKAWGKPDIVNSFGAEDKTGTIKEEWIYKSKPIPPIPVDAGYLSKNKYLYFDGNHLTLISDEPKEN